MTIGEKIKFHRIRLNLTQEDLASAANTRKQTIHKYEAGIVTNIPASKIKAIADKLETTPAYLMGWTDNETQKKNDILSDIILRLRSDNNFMEVVKDLYNSTDEQINVIKSLLITFKQ